MSMGFLTGAGRKFSINAQHTQIGVKNNNSSSATTQLRWNVCIPPTINPAIKRTKITNPTIASTSIVLLNGAPGGT